MKKPENQESAGFDTLTTAAEAIGSTLGKIAVKTGLVKPAARAPKRTAPRKKALRTAAPTKRKAVLKSATQARARGTKKGK
jgi:hypothetical protein